MVNQQIALAIPKNPGMTRPANMPVSGKYQRSASIEHWPPIEINIVTSDLARSPDHQPVCTSRPPAAVIERDQQIVIGTVMEDAPRFQRIGRCTAAQCDRRFIAGRAVGWIEPNQLDPAPE